MSISTTTVRFESSDGVALVGDLALPLTPRAGAIVCHPHPQFGGNRHNHVVGALHDALTAKGVASLRFDFRSDFDDGRGERLDARAALEVVRSHVPDVPVFAVGYSFGALVALGLDDRSLRGTVLVAPPLAMADTSTPPHGEVLVLAPTDDQFTSADQARAIVADWPRADFSELLSADHFLAAGADVAAEIASGWIDDRVDTAV